MRKVILVLSMISIFSCQREEIVEKYKISGFVQKGPFIQGSEVRIQELNSELLESGNTFFIETNDDFGSFELKSDLPKGYIDIATTGYYFNEIEGKLSNSFITLKGLIYLYETRKLNINILTTLSYDRLKYLIANENYSFNDARNKAQKEILKAFNIVIPESLMISFEEMDISKSGLNNSILLAISSILQYNNSEAELSELVKKISDDIEEDGVLNNESYITEIRENSKGIKVKSIIDNLSKRYSDLGLSVTIPNFDEYIDSDGDGIINKNETSNPVFSIQSGIYSKDIEVEISTNTLGAKIYYTLNGSTPDTTSTIYSGSIKIKGDYTRTTIKAVAKKTNLNLSDVVIAQYTINYPVIEPLFNYLSGSIPNDIEIILSTNINDAKIYYTTDLSNPTTNSTLYTKPIKLSGDGNSISISAIAIKEGFRSVVIKRDFYIDYLNASYPIFDQLAGTYNSDIQISLSSKTSNAIIYYTLDGTVPTLQSLIYESPISIKNDGSEMLVNAIAKSSQTKFSYMSTSFYKIDYSYNINSFNTTLSIANYKQNIVGTWIGYRECPWVPKENVEITFRNDGSCSSKSLYPGSHIPSLYYGSDADLNKYNIVDVKADGSATGELSVFSGTCMGEIRNIKFSESLNVLSFDFYHFNRYGPITFKLTRIK